MAPFFHFWGVIPSEDLVQQLSTLPESMDILEMLKYYRELVPRTKEDFQGWYDVLREKAGPSWYFAYDCVLALYDGQMVGQWMVDQIDFLITKYFTASSRHSTSGIEQLTVYPNPFAGSFTIAYQLPTTQAVYIHLSNLFGQKISTLFLGRQESGVQRVNWMLDQELPVGVYFLEVETNAGKATQKVIRMD